MNIYPLSNISRKINGSNLNLKFSDIKDDNIILSKTISKYLSTVKEQIKLYSKQWDIMKKITNPYEFIHTPLPGKTQSISKIHPLSRAFFKLIEICNLFDIFKCFNYNSINSFHLAEGPGGFIEAMTYLRFNKDDKYYGMTLLKKDCEDIPGWDKASLFLNKNKNVSIEKGVDGTGNLYNSKNYIHCIKNYKNSMDFITGDGGFDFSVNYNEQETQATRLILTQIAYAIGMQKKGGCFILKVFDLFTEPSLDFLYLLSSFYKNISIIKPYTSRLANSEKYIVCQNFKFEDTTEIINKFSSILHVLDNMSFKDIKISKILDVKINYYYIKTIEEINAILYHQQISNILLTLRIIQNNEKKTEKIELMKNKNIKKCLNWCGKNRIPHNRFGISSNIFLSGSRFNA